MVRQWLAERAARLRGETPDAAAQAPAPPQRAAAGASPTLVTGGSSASPTTEYALAEPPPLPLAVGAPGPELDAQVDELMRRDPAVGAALALAILRRLPTGALAAEADRVFGRAPPMVDSNGEDAEGGGLRDEALAPERLTVPSTAEGAAAATNWYTRRRRCPCCDEYGSAPGEGPCEAISVLDALGAEFDAREQVVAEELDAGYDLEATKRHARWFMYRTFVAYKYGYLGKGVRVTIPDCVIAEIRDRFRAPGCECSLDTIAACTEHGYRGHRAL
jgi:hypothetical protein